MKIKFRQSGGFAGLIRGVELDRAELPAKEAAQLDQLLRQPPAGPPSSTAGARDATSYELAVETAQGTKTVKFDDLNSPAGAAALLALLQQRSKPLPPA